MLSALNSGRMLRAVSVGVMLLASSAVAGVSNPCNCFADFNNDGFVDGADLGVLLGSWGPVATGTAADLNGDGIVDGADLGALLGAWGACAAPANDMCANALPVVAGDYEFCTVSATTDGPVIATAPCASVPVSRDVWFVYHALSDGTLLLSTCNSANFDTVIAVYGSTIPGLSPCPTEGVGFATLIGCNDDATDCALTSTLSVPVTAGRYYKIRVGGFSFLDLGSGVLHIALSQPGESCANHRDTNAFLNFQTVVGNTTDNPSNIDYPSDCFAGTPHGPTEWIRWESTCTGVVTVSTCNPGTDYDTVLTVLRYEFNGQCWSTYITCNDDSPQPGCNITQGGPNRKSYLQRSVSPGEVLYFLVSGWNGASGNYEMTIDLNCN